MLEFYNEIERIRRSSTTNLVAEVFFEELQFILGHQLEDSFMVKNHGMNSRAMSKDIKDVSSRYLSESSDYQDLIVIHLCRNSIYHQLPEMIFHPLVLSKPGMSNREIVVAMRENRKQEDKYLNFFSVFDTEIFKRRVGLNNRHLNFFNKGIVNQNFLDIAKGLLDVDLSISPQAMYKLFLNLCKVEDIKEDIGKMEELLQVVFEREIHMRYIPKILRDLPFECLGECCLGVDAGLCGKIQSEVDDIEVRIALGQDTPESQKFIDKTVAIKSVLHFLLLSNRDIHIIYTAEKCGGFVLGGNYLGYDTNINCKSGEITN